MIEAGDRSGGRSPVRPCVGGNWGSRGLELEDSLRLEVWALLEGETLWDGLGCGGEGGMGPTLVCTSLG